MNLNFMDFEIPLLKALIKLGGGAKPSEVYPEVEKMMGLNLLEFPEEYEQYKSRSIKWKNKTAWAREYLKRKKQLDGSERGVWKITEIGKEVSFRRACVAENIYRRAVKRFPDLPVVAP